MLLLVIFVAPTALKAEFYKQEYFLNLIDVISDNVGMLGPVGRMAK